ncbi:MAG TPA: hypothetical protein VGQ09_05095 [Chitinophagaceae bacterium]|jgi:hypothetical protein|nr:hypothetical protein [Chitinophagaceae bacterium]
MKNKLLFFIAFFFVCGQLKSQTFSPSALKLPSILPPTPEAASIVKNGQLTAGLYNGGSQASISLCDIKVGDFTLPITLNYASNGFKVDEIPSRVGMSWSLNTGGVITRVVNGKPDDQTTRYLPNFQLSADYQSISYYSTLIETQNYDAEPDEFRISAPGVSGKFILDNNNQPVLIPYSNLKIQMNGLNPFNEIIVTNTEGIRYYFGGAGAVEVTTNHTVGGQLSGFLQINTGFFLRKIKLLNGDSINFHYSVIPTRQITGLINTISKPKGCPSHDECGTIEPCPNSGETFTESYSDVRYNSLLLDSINTSNDIHLSFVYENRPDNGSDKRLVQVSIINGYTKKFKFIYYDPTSYGQGYANSMSEYNKRFFLQELQEIDGSGTDTLRHQFSYLNINDLPPRLTYAQDHYGYSNGAILNQTLLPSGYGVTSVAYVNANREPNGYAAMVGLLTKMKYPTGGFDTIVYEPNIYWETSTGNPNSVTATAEAQGVGQNTAVLNSSALIIPGRDQNGHLSLSTDISPSCTVCSPPDLGHDKIAEVYVYNVTSGGPAIFFHRLTDYTTFTADVPLEAGNTYILKIKVYGDYSYGLAELSYYDTSTQVHFNSLERHAPGVRVKYIQSKNGVTNINGYKFYKYSSIENFGNTSGITLTDIKYLTTSYSRRACPEGTGGGYNIWESDVLTSNTNAYQYTYDNNVYAYTAVIESDDSTFKNGFIEHTYEAEPFDWSQNVIGDDYIQYPSNTNTWYNGNELSTRYFNSEFQLVKEIRNYYHLDTAVNNLQLGVVAQKKWESLLSPTNPVTQDQIDQYNVNQYFYQSGWVQQDSSVTKDFDGNGNVKNSKVVYFYNSPANILPFKTETVNSKGQLTKEEKQYPTDFASQPYQRMISLNILSPVVVSTNFINNNQKFQTKTNYYDFSYSQSTADPIVIKPQTVQTQTFNNPIETRIRFHKYDSLGNPLELSKENDVKLSYIWGYNKTLPIAEATNANSNEIFFDSYEQPNTWDGVSYDDAKAHSGKYSGKISKPDGGELVFHSKQWLNISLTQATKFKYSGWIFTNGPSAEIFLFMKTATEQNYFTYVSSVVVYETNKWVYVEGEYTVPANITKLNIRIDNNGGGIVWFDDIRLRPSASQMKSYTYDPLIGMTSQCDDNNHMRVYTYDAFGRLILIRDENRNILKKYCYNYAGQEENCAINVTPNWQNTGQTRCKLCPSNSNYISNIIQNEQQDANPESPTYGQLQWVDAGVSGSCVPQADWQNTATAIRCKLVNGAYTGEQEREQIDINPCSTTYNTTRWIVIGTNCATCPKPANWQSTGNYRCVQNGGNNTGEQEREERDNESCSATYNQLRWVSNGTNCSSCPKPANWQSTGNYRCVQDANNNNTGYQEREERDNESCSATYNSTRWVSNGYNTSACPLPVYARIEYTDWYYDVTQIYATVWIKFYSNEACTVPVSVSGLSVNYRKQKTLCTSEVTNTYYNQTCNGSSVSLGSQLMSWDDGGAHCWWYDFYLEPGSGYIIVN